MILPIPGMDESPPTAAEHGGVGRQDVKILRSNVADGVAEAATIHIGSLVTRLRVVGRELHDAVRKLDELCVCLESRHTACRGFRASQPPRLPSTQDFVGGCARDETKWQVACGRSGATQRTSVCVMQSIIGRALQSNTIPGATAAHMGRFRSSGVVSE